MNNNFRLPRALKQNNPALYQMYLQNISVLNLMLSRSQNLFHIPEDFSAAHSLDMVEACCNILSEEAYAALTPTEDFILLMSCYLGEIGWNADRKTVAAFVESNDALVLPEDTDLAYEDFVRANHRRLGGFMVRRFRDLFEYPSMEVCEKVAGICECAPETLGEAAGGGTGNIPSGWDQSLYELAAVHYFADEVTRIIGLNQEVTWAMMKERDNQRIMEYVEQNAAIGATYEGEDIILYMQGSETVYELIRSRMEGISERLSLLSKGLARITVSKRRIRIQKITFDFREDVHVNQEIEEAWTKEDWSYFRKFSAEEKELYIHYLVAEYHVTRRLKTFADTRGYSLIALNHRVKTPTSIYVKVYVRKESLGLAVLKDMLRYTMILPEESYVASAEELLDDLKNLGFFVSSVRNAWLQKEIPYNGLNVHLQNRDGFRLEIQFHTKDSFGISKSREDHNLYEQKRLLDPASEEYRRIEKLQFALYGKMAVPPGIEDFKYH